jgi:hypothetical protein
MIKNEQAIIDDFTEDDKIENSVNLWNYKEQDTIIGIVRVINPDGQFGLSVSVETNDSEDLVVIPSLTALNTVLKQVKIGDKIKLVYTGEQKSNSSKYKYATFDFSLKKA